jgi:transposase-like protein
MQNSVLDAKHFHDEEAAYAYLEARIWPNGPVCPHCGGVDRVGKLKGKSTRIGVWKCYQCRKPFRATVGTVFESSHVPLRLWLQAVHLMASSKKGISSNQLHRTLGVTLKTAWFMSHRIREAMRVLGIAEPMGGEGSTLEADLTFVGRKPGTKVRVGPSHKNAVLSLVERDGKSRSFHVANIRGATLHEVIDSHASRKSDLMTDEENTFVGIGWNFASHGTVKHRIDEYVRYEGNGRIVSTNTVEGFFSILKRGIYGVYQHVSEAHLHRYLAEFDFRYSNRVRLGVNDVARADRALKGIVGKRLTYQTVNH